MSTTSQKVPTAGIYYVIPAQVFEDEHLEKSDIVFYALLSGLSSSYGYCFASDKYLAQRMKCTDREIRYMMKTLENRGYIRKETIRNGVNWDRKIFICHAKVDNSKNIYERNPNSAPPETERKPTSVREEAHFRIESKALVSEDSSSYSSKESSESERKKEEEPLSQNEALSPEEEEHLQKCLKNRSSTADPIFMPNRWKESIIRRFRACKSQKPSNETYAKLCISLNPDIQIGCNYIVFNGGPNSYEQIEFSDPLFMQRVNTKLQKWGIPLPIA